MSKNDTVIKELMVKLEEQKANLGPKPKAAWQTNGVFKFSPSEYFNINVTTDTTKFASALGSLLGNAEYFAQACKMLGVKGEFKWDGYSLEDWKTDFQTRVKIIEYDNKKKLLDATKAKLQSLVSEEERTAMELEDIQKLLAS